MFDQQFEARKGHQIGRNLFYESDNRNIDSCHLFPPFSAVREERVKHGLSLAEAGPAFGMTESELADLENGKIPPELAAAIKTEVAPENAEEVQGELFGDMDKLRTITDQDKEQCGTR